MSKLKHSNFRSQISRLIPDVGRNVHIVRGCFCQFSDINRVVLINVQSPHKWWSTLKSVVFGSSSSMSPLVS